MIVNARLSGQQLRSHIQNLSRDGLIGARPRLE
jgi:hypothetical protein